MPVRKTYRSLFGVSLLAAAVIGSGLTSRASAALLVDSAAPVPVQVTNSPAGANLVTGTGAVPFVSFLGKFSGTLTTTVYNFDPSNPFSNGTFGADPMALTFTFRIVNNANPTNVGLHRFVANDFSGFLMDDAGQNPAFAGDLPTSMDLTSGGVGFNFPPPNVIFANSTTTLLVVHTNADAWTTSIDQLIDTDIAQVASLAPAAVPEPASLGLLAAGLGLFARRRR